MVFTYVLSCSLGIVFLINLFLIFATLIDKNNFRFAGIKEILRWISLYPLKILTIFHKSVSSYAFKSFIQSPHLIEILELFFIITYGTDSCFC